MIPLTKIFISRIASFPTAGLGQLCADVEEFCVGVDRIEACQDSEAGPCQDFDYHRRPQPAKGITGSNEEGKNRVRCGVVGLVNNGTPFRPAGEKKSVVG